MTKSTWDIRQQKLVASGNQSSPFDGLPFPGAQKIQGLSAAEVTRLLLTAGVPGVSHSNGRDANLEAYEAHLDQIHKQAGEAAVAAWVKARQ